MKIYKCELCQKLFSQKYNLLNHVNRKFKCVNTDITTYTISDLVNIEKKEIKIIKNEIIKENEKDFFDSCQIDF